MTFQVRKLALYDGLLVFQLLQSGWERLRSCAGFNRAEHVRDGFLIIGKLLLIDCDFRRGIVLALLRRVYLMRKVGKHVLLQHVLNGKIYDRLLKPVPRDLLLVAGPRLAAVIRAVIIVPLVSRLPRSAYALHGRLTVAAEEAAGKQVLGLRGFRTLPGPPPLHFGLGQAEGLPRYNCGYAALDDYILVAVFPDVFPILNDSVDTVLVEQVALRGTESSGVQELADGLVAFPLYVLVKDDLDGLGGFRVNLKVLLFVHPITERTAAPRALAFQSALVHSSLDFLSELRRVVFRKAFHQAFEDNPFGAVRYGLGRIKDLNAVAFQFPLIECAVVFVPREAVRLIDDHSRKLLFLRVGDKPLEFGPLVGAP